MGADEGHTNAAFRCQPTWMKGAQGDCHTLSFSPNGAALSGGDQVRLQECPSCN